MEKTALRFSFFSKHSLRRILVDFVSITVVALLVFEILPRSVTFFSLASVHTTFVQKVLYSVIAIVSVLLFRTLLMVYKNSWSSAKILNYLNVIVADIIAGVLYYIITEYVFSSVYPFLLTLAMFTMIDILTLFVRLLYQGIVEDSFVDKKESAAVPAEEKTKS